MTLYTLMNNTASEIILREATTEDVKAWLSEHGLVAVPLEPTEEMLKAAADCRLRGIHDPDWKWYEQGYKAMIAAASQG